MLTHEDIENLKEIFFTKDEFYEFKEEIGTKFDNLQSVLDAHARTDWNQVRETAVLDYRMGRYETGQSKPLPKSGLNLRLN